MALEDLAAPRLGQLGEPADRTGDLEPSEMLAGEIDHGLLVAGLLERRAGPGDDDGVDRLTPFVARDAEDGRLVDVVMELEGRLDLGGIDVDATRDDHVPLAIADVQVALVVAIGDVTDRLEAVAMVLDVLVGLLVVVVEHRAASYVQLAGRLRPDA